MFAAPPSPKNAQLAWAALQKAQAIGAMVARLKAAGRAECLAHRKVLRPWGTYDGIESGERFQVKRILVDPGAALSLQMHYHRAEHWIVGRGTARVTRGQDTYLLTENESTYIPPGTRHRLENPGKLPLQLIEVQSGPYLGEDDVVRLADSYGRANSVVLPLNFRLGEPRGRPDRPLPDFVARNRLAQVGAGLGVALPGEQVQVPLEAVGSQAAALGHLNVNPDEDGGVRTEPLVIQYFDQYYPSLSLMIAARSLNLGPADIKVRLGEEVRLGNLRIPTDGATQMNTFFYQDGDGRPAFPVDSFYDVLAGKIPAGKYWIEASCSGSAALAGSWVPPVTADNQQGKPGANAKLYFNGAWSEIVDTGCNKAQDIPFLLLGEFAACKADINGDGKVCQDDLGILLGSYGTCPGDPGYIPAAGMIAGDPCVNQSDLGVLLGEFNGGCGDPCFEP